LRGKPVSDEEHKSQIKNAVEEILSWNLNAKIVGVWVDGSWNVFLSSLLEQEILVL